MLTAEQKIDIAECANRYIAENNLNASKFAQITRVNTSYMSNILNGMFEIIGPDNTTPIQDKYFAQIAEVVSYNIQKAYWPHIMTRHFVECINAMTIAKQTQVMKTIIIDSGWGKTYSVRQFVKKNPLHTYVVVMHSEVTINELFNELARQLGIPDKGTKGWKRAQILIKLREIKRNGGSPIVLIDEGENMNHRMLMMLKGLYDGVYGYASLVLIGTAQLWQLIEEAKEKDKQGGPQFYRRFRPGAIWIRIRQKRIELFEPFFTALEIEQPLQLLLSEMCENYGELHDYLEPALQKADEKGVPLTEEFFRLMYNKPKTEAQQPTRRAAKRK